MATNATAITTVEQLWKANLDQPCELIRGELVLMTPTNDDHGTQGGVIASYLGYYILENELGDVQVAEAGFIIARDPDTVRVPDFAFVSNARRAKYGRSKTFIPHAPDLAVEVKSPSDSYKAVEEKTQQWLEAGCRMVIVVDPLKKTVKQYYNDGRCETLDVTGVITGGEVVPGFELPVKKVFK